MRKLAEGLLDLMSLPGRWVGWLILPLILSVIFGIAASAMGFNVLLDWDGRIPVLGRRMTVNTLIDIQWYIFAMMVLFGGVYALRDERHVSVDFLYQLAPDRVQIVLRLIGDALFLVPFCLIITYYGVGFTVTSYTTGEGSAQGGLQSRWLIKACIPIAFGLLAATGLVRILTGLGALLGPATRRS